MTFLRACVLCCAAMRGLSSDLAPPAHSAPGQGAPAAPSLEEQVLANLRQQAVGTATIADLDMPLEFLKRVAGRILRASFEENFRIVVPDESSPGAKPGDTKPPDAKPPDTSSDKAKGESSRANTGRDAASATLATTAADESSSRPVRWTIAAVIAVAFVAVTLGVRRARSGGARGG